MPTYEIIYSRIKTSDKEEKPISNHAKAYEYLMRNCFTPETMWRESAWVVFLDKKNIPIGKFLLSTGGFDRTVLDIKLMAKAALDCNAEGIILSHNHTTGEPKPSQADIEQTKALKSAFHFLKIDLVDHIILTEEEYYSFSSEVTVKPPKTMAIVKAS